MYRKIWTFFKNLIFKKNEKEILSKHIDKPEFKPTSKIIKSKTKEKSKNKNSAQFKGYPKILYGYNVNDTIQGAPNFKIEELLRSATAKRKKIRNVPTQQQFKNLLLTTRKVLQPIRNQFGPVIVTSGFRCVKLCLAVGSTKNSNHARGEAVDFFVPGIDLLDVFKWIYKNLEFRELIVEGSREDIKNKNPLIIHCAYREGGNIKTLKHPVTFKPTTIEEIERYFTRGSY